MKTYDIFVSEKTCLCIEADFCIHNKENNTATFRTLDGECKGIVNVSNVVCIIPTEEEEELEHENDDNV